MNERKNFLLTVYAFDGWHGSLIHVCELAKALNSMGFSVYLTGVDISSEIKDYVSGFADLYFFEDLPLNVDYDYVLAYHEPICTYLIEKGLKYKKLAFGSLSSIITMEVPSLLCEYGFPLVVHNRRLEEYMKELFSPADINTYVFINSAPDEFICDVNLSGQLKNIVMISNHLPEELSDAAKILKNNNINVEIFGKGYNYTRITPEILLKYDLIITIGKTVQYALSMGIPVYNYDHFGGVGFIRLDNLDREEFYNFSGRSNFRKLSGKDIYDEIVSGYDFALKEINKIKTIARNRYSLTNNLKSLLNYLDNSGGVLKNTSEWKIYKARCVQYAQMIINYKKEFRNIKNLLYLLKLFYAVINKLSFGRCYKNKLAALISALNRNGIC